MIGSIYLGDRGCKRLVIDGWNSIFGVQVNCISRLRKGSTEWNYYTDKDIDDGWLVFSGLKSVQMSPAGPVPNDFLEIVEACETPIGSSVTISIGSVDSEGNTTEVRVEVIAKELSIETNEEFVSRFRAREMS